MRRRCCPGSRKNKSKGLSAVGWIVFRNTARSRGVRESLRQSRTELGVGCARFRSVCLRGKTQWSPEEEFSKHRGRGGQGTIIRFRELHRSPQKGEPSAPVISVCLVLGQGLCVTGLL